jgi:hypothetical protein
MTKFYQLVGVCEDDFHLSHRFLTSWLLPPILLAILRGVIALYTFTTIFFRYAWQGTHGLGHVNEAELSYFTSLTFWGIAFYFLISAIHTFLYARRGYAPLDHWPRPLQALHSLLYTTVVTFPFLVTIVYWVLLYDGTWFPNQFNAWSDVSLLTPYAHLIQTFTDSVYPTDHASRIERRVRLSGIVTTCHQSSAVAPPPISYLNTGALRRSSLSDVRDTRVLHIQLPGSSNRTRTGCCVLFWYTSRRDCGVRSCLATHLGAEKIYPSWKEESSRSVNHETW